MAQRLNDWLYAFDRWLTPVQALDNLKNGLDCGNLISGGSGFAVELAGGADGSSEFIRYYPPMQFRCGTQ
jgi:hypothetical protein